MIRDSGAFSNSVFIFCNCVLFYLVSKDLPVLPRQIGARNSIL